MINETMNQTIMFFNGTPGEIWTNSFTQTRTLSQVAVQYVNGFMVDLRNQLGIMLWLCLILNVICIFLIFFYNSREQKSGWMSWILLITYAVDLGMIIRIMTIVYKAVG